MSSSSRVTLADSKLLRIREEFVDYHKVRHIGISLQFMIEGTNLPKNWYLGGYHGDLPLG